MAACLGLVMSDNPFAPGTDDGLEWFRGYGAWERQRSADVAASPAAWQAARVERSAAKD